jgi:hypothetical protein
MFSRVANNIQTGATSARWQKRARRLGEEIQNVLFFHPVRPVHHQAGMAPVEVVESGELHGVGGVAVIQLSVMPGPGFRTV